MERERQQNDSLANGWRCRSCVSRSAFSTSRASSRTSVSSARSMVYRPPKLAGSQHSSWPSRFSSRFCSGSPREPSSRCRSPPCRTMWVQSCQSVAPAAESPPT